MPPEAAGPQLIAGDEHDERLRALVRPAAWTNPDPGPRYHLVVLGGGTGGLVTAAIAAGLGARVALVERHFLGGDCLNVGCVPSKGVLSAARGWHAAREAAGAFHGPAPAGDGDFAAAMARMRRLRAQVAPADSAARFRDLGVDVFLGAGRFTGPDTLQVGDATLRFRRAVIATGARAAVPPIPGLDAVPHLTNESVFTLTERPRHLLVLGAGPIGVELAQAFRRLGSAVTVVHRDPRILPRDDADAAAILAARLAHEGVRVLDGAAVERADGDAAGVRLTVTHAGGTEVLTGDRLLVASGRAPNVAGIGLEAAGVACSGRGVTVDDRLRTTNPRIYAVGDVASRWQFTHAADAMARLVVRNALFFGRGRASRLVIPWATYTSPEVAGVGLTAAEAAERGIAVDEIRVDLEHLDRAILDGHTDGLLRVRVARGTDRLVGATVVGEHAGELVGTLALAMTQRLGLGAFSDTVFPYPTQAEILRRAGDAWRRTRLTPAARGAFRRWFALLG